MPLLAGSGHPQQRLTRPGKRDSPALPAHADLFGQQDSPPEAWTDEAMLLGKWVLDPNVSINTFYKGGRAVLDRRASAAAGARISRRRSISAPS